MRELELELVRKCLEARGVGRAEGGRVPVRAYLDPERFEQELDAWHRAHPNLVAHGSELPEPGDFLTRHLLGRPVLLVRGDDGRVRASLNVCRHGGATVELREAGRTRTSASDDSRAPCWTSMLPWRRRWGRAEGRGVRE